jgi:integrase
MATIKFQLQSKSSNAPIYLRLSLNRSKSIKRKTGLFINPKEWSAKTGLPKQTVGTNKNFATELRNLETSILYQVNTANSKGEDITGDWLNYKIDSHFGRIKDDISIQKVTYWIQYIIDNAHLRLNGKKSYGISESRIKTYNGLLNSFVEFQGKKEYLIKDLSKRTFDDFKKWLFNVQKYPPATAIKKLTDLQAVVKEAKENNIEIAQDYDKVKFQTVSTYEDDENVITLSEEDIKKIEKIELKTDALINARKWLILSCYTGQRGTHLITRIIESNFKKRGYGLVISAKQIKGNKPILIPVLPKTKAIFENGLPYKISIQKLNKHIKVICKSANIDEPTMGKKKEPLMINGLKKFRNVKKIRPKHEYISTHTGRRTFATIHYKKLPTPVIMSVTGHTKESTFLKYIGQVEDSHIDDFNDFYKTKNKLENGKPHLEVIKNASNQ